MKDPARETTVQTTVQKTTVRKDDHLDLCSARDVQSSGSAGWDQIQLPHCALPDLDFAKISLETVFLGQTFSAPLLVSSMTGGSDRGEKINQSLARFAESVGIPMGVGSQRVALEKKDPQLFDLRKVAPKATLYANIGAVQLNYNVSADDCFFLVDTLKAQALILHLNPLQEAIQLEGDRNFKDLWPKISKLCERSPVPVILKETGCGLDPQTCVTAKEAGISALDVAGFGGTHWGYIEGLRHTKRASLGETFRGWGIPTAAALANARMAVGPRTPLIASGGIRTGLDVAKAVYLGADLAGIALPFLKATEGGDESLAEFFHEICEAIRVALFCTNCGSLARLQEKGKLELYENEPH